MFQPFCFYVGFAFGMFLFCYCFAFVVFLFCFQTMKNCSPCKSSVFELCWLKGSLFSMVHDLVFASLFLVLFVCNLNNEVVLFCVCVVCFLFVTRVSGFLVCVLWSCFISCCFVLKLCLCLFFIPLKNKNGYGKQTRNKMLKKNKAYFQLVQLCSQTMFLFWGWALQMHAACFAENTIE